MTWVPGGYPGVIRFRKNETELFKINSNYNYKKIKINL